MSVEIKIYGETAKDALDELSGLASGMRPTGIRPELAAPYGAGPAGPAVTVDEAYAEVKTGGFITTTVDLSTDGKLTNVVNHGPNPARKRGEPSPGKKRRTAAEVAEDEAADAREAQLAERIADDTRHSEIMEAGKRAISTGEARVDPENPEADDSDSASDSEQDAADEAAEVEAHRDPEKPLTIDDVKAVVMAYAEKYGMPAAQADGPRIFVEALGVPPKDKEFWKFSILPVDDQEKIRKVISIWQRATTENPFKH